ncbi:RrF2 family transcriptional regulator [Intestinimonas massiliensis (ex Afouda et al. 2020)]|uniref:RrF2 family transcriptional regulator n=1 Tax=Intestinimonas massiliensis (ex Afouda et al. 2020) TaxID=1673721 RepID=UPI001030A013|nr:Rrf2 family transcriptional regulator [Intestinimonas massiliensis (ex Afouda et al. 2020)]
MNGLFCVAVHALIYLDKRGCMLSSEELAANICTNPARVRKVMARLKKAGLVATKAGNEGGYHLLCAPGEVTLDRIADALEVRFVEPAWHSGGDVDCGCMVASGMAGVMDGLFDDLDRRCRERASQLSLADLEAQLEQAAAGKETVHGL